MCVNNKKANFVDHFITKQQTPLPAMADVFISYSMKDAVHAQKIKTNLEKHGISVDINTEYLLTGNNIERVIKERIRAATIVLAIISENSLPSYWVALEALEGFQYEKVNKVEKYIPVCIDKKWYDDEFPFEAIATIDQDIEQHKQRLKRALDIGLNVSVYQHNYDRLQTLRHNFGSIITRIRESLVADLSTDTVWKRDFPRLVKAIKVALPSSNTRQSPIPDTSKAPASTTPKKVFISYNSEDEGDKDELENHLAVLEQSGYITTWNKRKIFAGTKWEEQTIAKIEEADIALLLVSGSYLSNNLCSKEIALILQRQHKGLQAIPILLNYCIWEMSALQKLSPLPYNRQPVHSGHWKNTQEAYFSILQDLIKILQEK